MILAHIFGIRWHGFAGGILVLLFVLACIVIIACRSSKSEPKP